MKKHKQINEILWNDLFQSFSKIHDEFKNNVAMDMWITHWYQTIVTVRRNIWDKLVEQINNENKYD